MPEICWEEIAKEIFFCTPFRCLTWGVNRSLTSNKPTHYLQDKGMHADTISYVLHRNTLVSIAIPVPYGVLHDNNLGSLLLRIYQSYSVVKTISYTKIIWNLVSSLVFAVDSTYLERILTFRLSEGVLMCKQNYF